MFTHVFPMLKIFLTGNQTFFLLTEPPFKMVEMVKMNGKMIVGTSSYQMDEDEEGYAAVSEVGQI